jgi:hypothetical protein
MELRFVRNWFTKLYKSITPEGHVPTNVRLHYRNTFSTVDLTLMSSLWFVPEPMTVAARSKVWTVFARSNAGIVGSNPTQDMDVCVRLRLFRVCVILCVNSGLAMGWSPVQEDLSTLYRIKSLKKRPRSNKDCRAIGRYFCSWSEIRALTLQSLKSWLCVLLLCRPCTTSVTIH